MSELIAATYEVISQIGAGGGGVVYLANHIRLGKKVILKADKRKLTTRPELLRREVDVLKNLNHPYIPQVYDFFVENETVYTVMEFIEGESLDRPLKRGERYPQSQVIQWACQLLDALSYLHSPIHGAPPKGYVHSDIKPANLMRTPDNKVCLIDFNIALALGEENVIGCSAGYASPEHYGLDFSSDSEINTFSDSRRTKKKPRVSVGQGDTKTLAADESGKTLTMLMGESRKTAIMPEIKTNSGTSGLKVVVPDIRSDIYSVGATLYHLLSGNRPARNAHEVIRLSEEEFSPQIVAIIERAMAPNPDERYQTADEMLDAFTHLHEKDVRTCRFRRNRRICCAFFLLLFTVSAASSFVGLKRMQAMERFLKLAEYSRNALAEGDQEMAVRYAVQAVPEKAGILEPRPPAQIQRALTDALGVYDLADEYKIQGVVELPAAPLSMCLAPNGKTACCIYAGFLAVIDIDSREILETLPADISALSEVKYLNDQTILYAGDGALQAYDIKRGTVLWRGKPATSISISGDGKRVAAIYRDESFATIYNAENGNVLYTVAFEGKQQRVVENDIFANPHDDLLEFNQDGTLLSVSFADGTLRICHLDTPEKDLLILEENSGYRHFEGGFCGQYFAFSALSDTESFFQIIDTQNEIQTGGFEMAGVCHVQTDKDGIYVQSDNVLVEIHPVTGEQTSLVEAYENIMSFARTGSHTLITTETGFSFFDGNAGLTSSFKGDYNYNFVQIAGNIALIGSSDSPIIRIMGYENHLDAEIFSYDPLYSHDEARLSADGKSIILFSSDGFRLYGISGELKKEVIFPDGGQIYDQQYQRDGSKSRLEVFYYDGRAVIYDGSDGRILREEQRDIPDRTLYEEFFTDRYRIASPLHGTPVVYDKKTGRQICELEKDTYLTYVTEIKDFMITQYVTADGYCYGQLLNQDCEVLADLPYLSDIVDNSLIFDYPTGNLRQSPIYDMEELLALGRDMELSGDI